MYDWEIPFVQNTYQVPFANTFKDIEEYILLMNKYGTKPEFEVYDVGMLSNIQYFIKKGILKTPVYIQFVIGVMAGIPASVNNLNFLKRTADEVIGAENYVWSCAATGKSEFEIGAVAAILGGNIRVGLEDNLYLEKGVLAKSNAELVAKMARICGEFGKEIATSEEARQMLYLG
jgi:uncharacterized protein (DUF849 family)